MKLRPPAVPLITVDPYFNIWSMADTLNGDITRHWTGKPMPITAIAEIDGIEYTFIGLSSSIKSEHTKLMVQKSLDVNAFSSTYIYTGSNVELTAVFTTPLLMDNLKILSTPITYLSVQVKSMDSLVHQVNIKIYVSEEICLDYKGEKPVVTDVIQISNAINCAKIGAKDQVVLGQSGDDLRINWGYFYLAGLNAKASEYTYENGEKHSKGIFVSSKLLADKIGKRELLIFAYDDIYSIEYFGDKLRAYWKKDNETIEQLIVQSFSEYNQIFAKCEAISNKLYTDAEMSGNAKYADMLMLAYRQVIAAHKLVLDNQGNTLFISKECYSNGCAATVDVSYPSIPMFLLYNPELIKGMLRPIFLYAESVVWKFDFAPHDAGCYPIVNGQVYGSTTSPEYQMPVEECGNMLIITAAVCVAQKDASFAMEHIEVLKKWADYLVAHGLDPENQLCTDDFAGHLSHNANLSVKAIMAIAGFSIICETLGNKANASFYLYTSKTMARQWETMAANGDGSFKLAFNQQRSFSLKYNLIWDILFDTCLFPKKLIESEVKSYINLHMNKYGVPLDNRQSYTKSDWLMYCAALAYDNKDFACISDSLWSFYNDSVSRVPMTDWYDTITAKQMYFQNRTVQGGLFIKLLKQSGICSYFK
jgi:hypothetical protein